MKDFREREFATYPRRFIAYRWYKPILVGLLAAVFYLLFAAIVYLITYLVFGTGVSASGYDDLDLFSPAGVFFNSASLAVAVPALFIASKIVKDRPFSSYCSSMGGWRWKTFLKLFFSGFIVFGIPYIARFLILGKVSDTRFTSTGLILMFLMIPLQCVSEEFINRSFVIQTIGSWFRLPIIGLIASVIIFAMLHPYNLIGVINISISALIFGLLCLCTRGIEASSALHILNNVIGIFFAGMGYGQITAQTTVPSMLWNAGLQLLFLLFVIYADKKLHWFDEVRRDDIEAFDAGYLARKRRSSSK